MKPTRGSGPPEPQPSQPRPGVQPNPLSDVLELARREGALAGEGLAAFLEGLRERARVVLAERFERLEDRQRLLEAEAASLRREIDWRRESMAALKENVRALGQQAERLSDELRRASEAHNALLTHHRDLVERVAAELASIASLSPLRARQARRRLLALAELLRVDSR